MTPSDPLAYFKETFHLSSSAPRKLSYRIKHGSFSKTEKDLLKALVAFKKRDKEEVLHLLNNKKFNPPFFEATRLYLLGITLNNFGHYVYAIEKLEQAIQIYSELAEDKYVALSLISLVLVQSNTKNIKAMVQADKQLATYTPESDYMAISIKHAHIVSLVTAGEMDQAKTELDKILSSNNPHLHYYESAFLLISFSISLKANQLDDCFKILELYKDADGFAVKANYAYMKALLNHLAHDAPLYVYDQDFINFPELHHQIEIIRAYSRGDFERIKKFWNILQKHNPLVYCDQFQFKGEICLFSILLDKYQANKAPQDLKLEKISQVDSPLKKLELIFSQCEGPIQKEELITLIWNAEIDEKSQNRLRKLVSRYNQKKAKKIVSRHDTYCIKKSS